MKYIVPILFFVPQVVGAQGLVPCGFETTPGNPATFVPCQACHLVQLTSNTLTLLIQLGTVLAVLMIVVGGFYLLSSGGSEVQRSRGKRIITNVIIGLVIMLTAWLLVDTVFKLLLSDEAQKFGVWNEIQCVEGSSNSESGEGDGWSDIGNDIQSWLFGTDTSKTEGDSSEGNGGSETTSTDDIPRIGDGVTDI
ncbi:pilin [Candidatus Kaiserbacteria bacterium]|nr:pilin [Candidatus Kaiserbacteria bacterium]